MIKGSIQEEDIILINIYAPNIEAPRYIQQILRDVKGEIDENTIIVRDFNTPLTSMDRSSRQKTNKVTEILKATIEKFTFLTSSVHYIQKNQNTPSSQMCMEHSQGLITYWGTKLTSTSLRHRNYFKYLL